ncbi:hypothetical protein TIFTF001_002905 [Ficus carica]|uniref:Uncharacterized protein n=1 Tax=Ficus carica TaxID=3494 RepID=A0AA87Z5P2_FICCA|nr:hypothetical protein TIFTF001_002905 [Ficus carica]
MRCLLRALQCLSQFGSSGDPDGSYSEWSRQVDMLRVISVSVSVGVQYCVSLSSGYGMPCYSTILSRYGMAWQEQHGSAIPKGTWLWSGKCCLGQYLGVRWLSARGSQKRGNSGINSLTEVLVRQSGDPRRDFVCSCNPSSLV